MFGSVGPAELILLILILVIIAPFILFLLTLQKALSRCSPENQACPPGWVWFLFVPLFNIIWLFVLVSKIALSLEREFQARSIPVERNPGRNLGMTWGVLNLASGSLMTFSPVLGYACLLGAFVCWISYWVKISAYSTRLAAAEAAGAAPAPGDPAP